MNTNDSMTAPRSRFTYAECVDAYGLFWQGKLSDDLEWAEVHAVLNGKMLAADDNANFTLPQTPYKYSPTSLEVFNRGY